MSVVLAFGLIFALATYWLFTQVLPERKRVSLARPALADGLLETVNDRRHAQGLALLEMDDTLMAVAENKAVHQVMTGRDEEGWDYPSEYAGMFGRSLLIEVLLAGPAQVMGERLARQREMYDGEWVRCGIGVAGGASGQIVVALILCREAWEPAVGRAPLARVVFGG